MTIWDFLFLASCTALSIVPPLFIWNGIYQDGVVGRLSLAGISFCSAAFILRAWDGQVLGVDGLMLSMHASFAVFLVWHLWRFHRRVLRKRAEAERRHEDPRFLGMGAPGDER